MRRAAIRRMEREDGSKTRSGAGERGSALLIVFVMASIVAITLYMELPVAAFEAQRQKEQLLISRGNEYAHAIKLFVRKTGRYPSSLKELADTNHMRFLRHEYKDPFTGKSDWRLLHAGPGGMIVDSKVKGTGGMILPGMTPGQQNQSAGMATSMTSFGSSTGSSSGNTFAQNDTFSKPPQSASDSSSADSTPPEVVVQQPRQRGPAVTANGSAQNKSAADAAMDAAMALPPLPPLDGQQTNQKTAKHLQGAPQAATAQSGVPQTGAAPNAPNPMPVDANGAPDMKAAMLSATNNAGRMGSSSSMGQTGTIQGGGIAGVASKAGGQSIKTVNDQDDYSLWEFYYDPRKDTVPGGVQAGSFAQPQNGSQQPQQSAFGGQSSAFGQGSAFGQSSSSGQGFGQSAPPQNTQPAPDANANPAPTNPQ